MQRLPSAAGCHDTLPEKPYLQLTPLLRICPEPIRLYNAVLSCSNLRRLYLLPERLVFLNLTFSVESETFLQYLGRSESYLNNPYFLGNTRVTIVPNVAFPLG